MSQAIDELTGWLLKVQCTPLKECVYRELSSIALKMNLPPGNEQPLPRQPNEKVALQRVGGGNMSLLPNWLFAPANCPTSSLTWKFI